MPSAPVSCYACSPSCLRTLHAGRRRIASGGTQPPPAVCSQLFYLKYLPFVIYIRVSKSDFNPFQPVQRFQSVSSSQFQPVQRFQPVPLVPVSSARSSQFSGSSQSVPISPSLAALSSDQVPIVARGVLSSC